MAEVFNIQQILTNRILNNISESIEELKDDIEDELERQACVHYGNLSQNDQKVYRHNVGIFLSHIILCHPCMKNIIEGEIEHKGGPLTSHEMFDLLREMFPWE